MRIIFSKISSSLNSIYSYVWPINKSENKKFFLMFSVFFLISFNYNALRAVKDTLIVTAPSSGAEAIPFIKLWIMLPTALIMTLIFTRLSNRYGKEKVFYIMVLIFLGFFAIFTLCLYPAREFLHPTTSVAALKNILPTGLHGFVAIISNWTLTCFYVMSELWGALILSVLFWGFANEVTSVTQATRFYSLLSCGANISGALSGQAVILLSRNTFIASIPYGTNAWEQSILYLNVMIIVVGFFIMAIFRYLNKKVLINEQILPSASSDAPKIKMSLRKNFAYLAKSKYLICIAILVVTYNIVINLIEVVWKNQVKLLHPNPSDYNIYMGQVMTIMGILATVIAIFLSGNLLRRFSWTITAMIPPIIILLSGLGFFSCFLFKDSYTLSLIAGFFSTTPLAICVFFGSMQNCISRSLKYTLFDATKEISFIPLSSECKLKGKAAIDGVGSRIGKSGGSVIHQGLLLVFSTLTVTTPYVAVIFIIFAGVWLLAVKSLGKQFHALVSHNETISIPEETKAAVGSESLTTNPEA
jgi:ATP:ADP antiporter, AAA family